MPDPQPARLPTVPVLAARLVVAGVRAVTGRTAARRPGGVVARWLRRAQDPPRG